jgi:hypothetical protein
MVKKLFLVAVLGLSLNGFSDSCSNFSQTFYAPMTDYQKSLTRQEIKNQEKACKEAGCVAITSPVILGGMVTKWVLQCTN